MTHSTIPAAVRNFEIRRPYFPYIGHLKDGIITVLDPQTGDMKIDAKTGEPNASFWFDAKNFKGYSYGYYKIVDCVLVGNKRLVLVNEHGVSDQTIKHINLVRDLLTELHQDYILVPATKEKGVGDLPQIRRDLRERLSEARLELKKSKRSDTKAKWSKQILDIEEKIELLQNATSTQDSRMPPQVYDVKEPLFGKRRKAAGKKKVAS